MASANSTDSRETANGTDRTAGTQPQTRQQGRDGQPRGGQPPSREGRRPSTHHGGHGSVDSARSTWTVAACAVLGLLGITSLLAGLALGRTALTATAYGAAGAGVLIGVSGLLLGALGLAECVAAVGLWTGREWASTAALAVSVAGAAGGLIVLVGGSPLLGLLGVALHGGVAAAVYSRRERAPAPGARTGP